jgi:beta-glucanase (GH16 family)
MPAQSRSVLWVAIAIGAVLVAATTFLVAKTDHAVGSINSASSSSAPASSAASSPAIQSPAPTHSVSHSASPTPSPHVTSTGTPFHKGALTWDDEFNSTAGLNGWNFETGNIGGPSEGELQWYDQSNATVSNGNLVMTATKGGGGHQCWNGACRYTSVRMISSFSQTYGLFEARIKLAGGQGIWPAFWMQGADYPLVHLPAAGEIDIVEVNGKQPVDQLSGFVHEQNGDPLDYYDTLPQSIYDGYHVYAVEWTPQGITWLVDGQQYGHFAAPPGWGFNHPFNIILSLAVGGGWPGSPNASTHFPVSMYVNWLKVYSLG